MPEARTQAELRVVPETVKMHRARCLCRDGGTRSRRQQPQYSCVCSVKTLIVNSLNPSGDGESLLAKPTTRRIFITLSGPSLTAMEAQAGRFSSAGVGYELRLDYLQNFTDFEVSLHQRLLRTHFPQVIATCRREEAGGAFKGSVEEQAAILAAAVRAG